jgi:LPS export ABC transporter protein LptC
MNAAHRRMPLRAAVPASVVRLRHAFAAIAVVLASACERSAPSPASPCEPPATAVPALQHLDAPLVGSGTDPTRASGYLLTADSGYAKTAARTLHLCGVRLEMYDSSGAVAAVVTASAGEYDEASDEIVATGDVVIDLPLRARRLETDELHFVPRSDRLWSPRPTRLYRNGSTIVVDSFTSNSSFTDARLYRVRGVIEWR